MKYPREWETVVYGTQRLKVAAGWIVLNCGGEGAAMCFVPDSGHKWVLEKETNFKSNHRRTL